MIYREAVLADIPQMSVVRLSVKENVLSDPGLITAADYEACLVRNGKGWVCDVEGQVVGFAIVDLIHNNVWALFVHPDEEGKGIGKRLQKLMLDWYFAQTSQTIWLSTAAGSKAATFYRLTGWTEIGPYGKGEVKFEMKRSDWILAN